MNWDIVESNWEQFKHKVKTRWSKLTDVQLDIIAGKRTRLLDKIQEAYRITREEAERQIRSFEKIQQRLSPHPFNYYIAKPAAPYPTNRAATLKPCFPTTTESTHEQRYYRSKE